MPPPSGYPAALALLLMYQVHSVQPQNAINFSEIYSNSKYTSITIQHKKLENLFQVIPKENPLNVQNDIQGDTKKRELLKNPTKIEEIQEIINV